MKTFKKLISLIAVSSLAIGAFSLAGCAYSEDLNRAADAVSGVAEAVAGAAETVKGSADVVQGGADMVKSGAEAVKDGADVIKDGAETVKEAADTVKSIAGSTQNNVISEEAEEEMQEAESEPLDVEAQRAKMRELVADMGAGFNLGNSLDSTGLKSVNVETHWGNPKTTPEMIKAIADKGFKTIRIPVSWGDHTGKAPDYEIDKEWMDRVQEVVDYAHDAGLYVILNTHHEENTWLNTDPANEDEVTAQLVKTWEQICERFGDYDDKLIFEGMNEPRLVGSKSEWSGGTKEEREVVNRLNQAFIDTVRSTGGINESRPLIICTYATSAERSAMSDLAIPEDDGNIIVAIHAYTPYGFTFEDPNVANYPNWSVSHKKDIVYLFQGIDKYFIQNGIPVIMDEFGAQNKDNREDIDAWLTDYLTEANKYGVKCVWWDNGNFNGPGEKFAIFDRNNCTWYAESTADILVQLQN